MPLVAHAIEAARASMVDETWVSTEDAEIAQVAAEYGARVLRRPPELASDEATTEDALLHFASAVAFDRLILLQCTCPFTTSRDIDSVLEMLDEFDSVCSVTRIHQFVWVDGQPTYDPRRRPRRQDAPATFLETGGVYGVRRETLLQRSCRIGGKLGFLEVPRIRSFDIDTYEDLELVRSLLEKT